ncbi:MAG: hypothetical protein M3P85_13865 [Actinomycetota bacterium]|nr:hypothetical protein [Actinomycetota bacterium]
MRNFGLIEAALVDRDQRRAMALAYFYLSAPGRIDPKPFLGPIGPRSPNGTR